MNQENNKKPMTMEEIHQSQMDIIRYIDKLCRDNNIKYSLAYGTLLGAIRHKGFIPWDDDMDIMMERVDYNKFLDIMKKDKSDRFNVINYENAYFPWTKICDGNTYIIEKDDYRIPNYALWVDVFPIDEMPEPNSEECKKHLKNLQTIKNKAKYRALTFGFARKKSFVKCIMITLYKLPLQFFSITHFGKKWNEVAQKYNGKNTHYKGYAYFDQPIREDLFKEYMDTEYEGETLQIIKMYDKYLTQTYGDYMQLPPENERTSGHTFDAYRK